MGSFKIFNSALHCDECSRRWESLRKVAMEQGAASSLRLFKKSQFDGARTLLEDFEEFWRTGGLKKDFDVAIGISLIKAAGVTTLAQGMPSSSSAPSGSSASSSDIARPARTSRPHRGDVRSVGVQTEPVLEETIIESGWERKVVRRL